MEVRIDDAGPDGQGRIVIGGATLATGYRNPPEPDPFAEPGWFVTDDIGLFDESGRLAVLGRIDDAISTGGLTVMPGTCRSRADRASGVAECAVFWCCRRPVGTAGGGGGGRGGDGRTDSGGVAGVGGPVTLDRTAAPREVHFVRELPRRGIGGSWTARRCAHSSRRDETMTTSQVGTLHH